MDFGKLMSAQIAKKQPPPVSRPYPSPSATDQKYLKRAELEAARETAYQAEQKHKEDDRIERATKKRKLEDEEFEKNREREAKRHRLAEESKVRRLEDEASEERKRRKRLGLPDLPLERELDAGRQETPLQGGEEDIEEDLLISKLREAALPTKLFGETHVQRLRRYRKVLEPPSTTETPDGSLAPRVKTVM